MSLTPPKRKTILKQSLLSTAGKSANNTPMRASAFTNVREIPLDPKSHYTISYVPGMVEHEIDTGKTFEDARLKIVLLSCELERVNNFNYSLVRENEVLRVQANKSEREKDLETKLAIVLAENEKLNQVIEEVYEVYMSQRGYGSNEEYELRISELHESLEDWKQKYNVLEAQGNITQLQNTITELQSQRELLTEQLTRKDRDLEALKVRLASLDKTPSSDLQNKVRTIIAENEKLNDLLSLKVEEIRELRYKLEDAKSKGPNNMHTITTIHHQEERAKKSAAVQDDDSTVRIQALNKDNTDLKQQLEYLKSQVGNAYEFEDRLRVIMEENEKLVTLIHERERELNVLREASNSSRESQAAVDRLSDKIRQLLSENDNLHKLLEDENARRGYEAQKDVTLIQTLKEKIIIISQENERLNSALDAKRQELEALSRRASQAEINKITVESYEEKVRVLSAELRQANEAANERQREVDSLKYKAYEAQNSAAQLADIQAKFALLASENERLNREVEGLRAKVREDKTAELQQTVSFLYNEKFRLEALLKEKEGEENMRNSHVRSVEVNMNELRGQNEQLKNAGVDQKKKIGDLESRLSMLLTLESRVSILNFETEKLQNTLADKDHQIDAMSQLLGERERESEELRKRLANAENTRAYEIEDVKAKVQAEQDKKTAALRADMESELRRLVQEKKQVEDRANQVSAELNRLQTIIQNVKGELESWKLRYTELEQSQVIDTQEIENLRRQFEALKSMNVQVKDLQQKFGAERSAYETQILQLGQIIQDLEYQTQMLSKENERITALSIQRLNQIEELRINNNEESLKLEVYELRNELERVKSSSYDIKQMAIQFNTERATDRSKINELQNINASYKADIEKLQALMEQRKTDYDAVNRQNEDLRKICEKLNQQNRSSISASRVETIEILETRVNELEKSRNDYQRQAERNALELTRKNRELVDKIQELDVIKLKYEEALANYQALNNQVFARLSYKN